MNFVFVNWITLFDECLLFHLQLYLFNEEFNRMKMKIKNIRRSFGKGKKFIISPNAKYFQIISIDNFIVLGPYSVNYRKEQISRYYKRLVGKQWKQNERR